MAERRNNRLLSAKLNKYIVPGIMMSLALQLGNIVDTIFVSNLIGVEAMSAVTMSLPVETIIQLTGYCLGIGGSIAAGNMLGKRDKESASKLFSATFLVTLVVGIIFSICAFPTAAPIARLLVPGGGILQNYTRDYIRISMLGAPVIGIGLLVVNYLGVENHPELASAYLILANVINLVLDYIFLRYTPLGVTGASLSTVLGFLFAMSVFVLYIRSDKRNIQFVRLKGKDFGIIKEALVEKAAEGKIVVRLKGGDPFLFGRGAEEAEELRKAGAEVHVVPGVSSSISVPELAGIPVTHRDYASLVTFITGHEKADRETDRIDWRSLVSGHGTLVIMMGLGNAKHISEELIAGGMSADMPTAVISKGSTPDQKVVVTKISELASSIADNSIEPPGIIVVGEVAKMRDILGDMA